jgi:hypothetical protein
MMNKNTERKSKSKELSGSESILEQVHEMHKNGLESIPTSAKEFLELRIEKWPLGWGDDLHILIYGDFEPPRAEIHIKSLGITIHPEKEKNTVISCAYCVLEATVKIKEKNFASLVDAKNRINVFLGVWTLADWGNNFISWWSYVTHGTGGGCTVRLFDEYELQGTIDDILKLPKPIKQKVEAAIYWVREPKNSFKESYRNDLLRTYVAYWNAFECLVEAINILNPLTKLSKSDKKILIDEFVSQRSGNLTAEDIQTCYQEIVNPGFVGKAKHALTICFPENHEMYITECFTAQDKPKRLYNIRNAINHGDIDAENLDELIRIESRLSRLWMIVWQMFSRLVRFHAPVDSSSAN